MRTATAAAAAPVAQLLLPRLLLHLIKPAREAAPAWAHEAPVQGVDQNTTN